VLALPGGQPERADGAHRDPVRQPVAAAGGLQDGGQHPSLAGRDVEGVLALAAGRRDPGVAQHAVQRSGAGVDDRERHLGRLAQPAAGGTAAAERQRADRLREPGVQGAHRSQHERDRQHRPQRRDRQHRQQPERGEPDGPPGEGHC
jgi:hypothetical protein